MIPRQPIGALLLGLCLIWACGGDGDVSSILESLPPTEEFNWGGQPISVSPPPESWRREKEQSGGLRGARFIKTGSVGEEIRLTEHYSLAERDRCERLSALLSDLDNLDRTALNKRVQRARLYPVPPINSKEATLADAANASLDRARANFLQDQMIETRTAITQALEQAGRIHYSLNEVVDRVMFSPTSYDSFGTVEVEEPIRGELAGEPSVTVDFTLDSTERPHFYHGRQVYVLKNNRLFVLTFFGLSENLPLFDAIVETVSFPPGQCSH